MMATFLLVATILFVKGENDYSDLGISLPRPLRSHISAIYENELYVFGGINGTGTYNTGFFKISLEDKFTINAEKDDITSSLNQNDWVQLDVSAPTYGPNTNNQFACDNQCSAVIGKYLYIVGAYYDDGEDGNDEEIVTNTVYRLDLSQNPPVFAGETDFPSTQGYPTACKASCVVAIDDILYTTTGQTDAASYEPYLTSYNPSTNTQSSLADNTGDYPRKGGMCVGNVGESTLYLLGGRTSSANRFFYGSPFVDSYSISTNEWTIPTAEADKDFYDDQNSFSWTTCITSLYSNKAECPGGKQVNPLSTSYIFNLGTNTDESVNLNTGVAYAGVDQYEFYNTGSEGAFLMIVTGGDTSTSQNDAPIATIQYSVRYGQITDAPSAAPIQSPTPDTTDPTKAPSRSPLCTGCTFDPSSDPTPSPTDGEEPGDDSSAIKLCMVIACIMGILSVVIV